MCRLADSPLPDPLLKVSDLGELRLALRSLHPGLRPALPPGLPACSRGTAPVGWRASRSYAREVAPAGTRETSLGGWTQVPAGLLAALGTSYGHEAGLEEARKILWQVGWGNEGRGTPQPFLYRFMGVDRHDLSSRPITSRPPWPRKAAKPGPVAVTEDPLPGAERSAETRAWRAHRESRGSFCSISRYTPSL